MRFPEGDKEIVRIGDLMQRYRREVWRGISAWYRQEQDYSVADAELEAERISNMANPVVTPDLARAVSNRIRYRGE